MADRIEEYAALGITEFILSGYPHLEEAYWFGEGVLPILRRRGLWQHPDPDTDDAAERDPVRPDAPRGPPGRAGRTIRVLLAERAAVSARAG